MLKVLRNSLGRERRKMIKQVIKYKVALIGASPKEWWKVGVIGI